MIKRIAAAGAALALLAAGPAQSASPAASLAAPYARFGFDLLRAVDARNPGKNVFISPTSVAVALAFAANAAGGRTQADMLAALHAPGSLASFDAANKALASEIARTTTVKLSMANALWLQAGFAAKPRFVATARDVFGAQAGTLDFRSRNAVDIVNAWAKRHTDGLIPHVLDRIDPLTVTMLANAIAFDGRWSARFDPAATKPHTFSVAWTGKGSVAMMQQTGRFAYAASGGLQTIRLPYGDKSFAMYVVLPKDRTTLAALVERLTPASFDGLVGSLRTAKGTIGLPRFRMNFSQKINDELIGLGFSRAFSDAADFSDLSSRRLKIGDVHHASYLNVDEKGTRAAAVTTVGVVALAMRHEPPPFSMIVDRPFLVAIRDESTGQLLFLGTIVSPG